jgi:hypothetical protein
LDRLKGVECNPRPLGRHNVEVGKCYLAEPRDKNRVSLVLPSLWLFYPQELTSKLLSCANTLITKFCGYLVFDFTGSPIQPPSRCLQEVCTLYPLVRHRDLTTTRSNIKTLSFLARLYLIRYSKETSPPPLPKQDGIIPPPCPPMLLSHHKTGVQTVQVQIRWLPKQSWVVALVMSIGSEGWQISPYTRQDNPSCSHLTRLRQHL